MNKSNIVTSYHLSDILGAPCSYEDALLSLQSDVDAYRMFLDFPPEEQKRILSFMQGSQGLKIIYDSFFKKIMDPDVHPQRLEHFLSAILGDPIHIHAVLPKEGTKLTDSGSLVIMDIVVELSNGSLIDVEMQKIGYTFPGERSDCYVSDFIMRQYNRVKNERKKHFSFKDLKPVYLIVIMENSSKDFSAVSPSYLHRKQTCYDSGAKVNSLSNIIYISLDTFHSVVQNIGTELDAWLTFLSSDAPADIIRLVDAYPEFKQCYQDILTFRTNPKELITMYSEALTILDRNTTKYMCEEMQKQITEQAAIIEEKNLAIAEQNNTIAALQAELERLKNK